MISQAKTNRTPVENDFHLPSHAKVVSRTPDNFAESYAKLYEKWHWGEKPQMVIDWPDTDFPPNLIECGRLVRLHFRAPGSVHPRRQRDTMLEFAKKTARRSFLAYDPDHPNERLYLLVDPAAWEKLSQRFWHENTATPMPLGEMAMLAGGRHGKTNDYPDILIKPIGILVAFVYHTTKKTDGSCYYIHNAGEESCFYPVLCCDEIGRLWLAGGNYTCPVQGVTD
jgi:hypothetical protein